MPKKSNNVIPSQGYKDHLFQDIPCETVMPRQDLSPHQYNIISREGYNLKTDEIYIFLQFRVLKKNAANQFAALPDTEPVTTVNNFLYSAFKGIELLVNGQQVYQNMDYQLTTYLQTLLYTSGSKREMTLASALYKLDNPGEFEVQQGEEITTAEYPVLHWRMAKIDRSATCLLAGQLLCAPLNQTKLLPDGLDFTLRLYPADPNQCLISSKAGAQYCVEWISGKLKVARVLPKASIGKQLFSYVQPCVYTFTHNKTVQTWGPRQILQGYLPSKIILLFQQEKSRTGSYLKNPLQFIPNSIQEVIFTQDGIERPKKNAFKLQYTEQRRLQNYDEIYLSMFSELGESMGYTNIPVTRESFRNGFFMLPINLKHGSNSNGKSLYGSCVLQVNFKNAALDDNIVILVYCEYDRHYTIGPLIKKQRLFDHHPIGSH